MGDRNCTICGASPLKARGWCRRCYARWLQRGDPTPLVIDDRTRFEALVDRSGGPDACHPWLGSPNAYGYGRIRMDGKARPAQAVAWEMTNGPLPIDAATGRRLEVDHECHNQAVRIGTCKPGVCPHRLCCNERHLVPRTQQEHGSPAVTEPLRGSSNPLAKLTEADIPLIRAALAAGERQVDIAGRFGVVQVVISSIKLGKTWKHVA